MVCTNLPKARLQVEMYATRHNVVTSNELPLKRMLLNRKYEKISYERLQTRDAFLNESHFSNTRTLHSLISLKIRRIIFISAHVVSVSPGPILNLPITASFLHHSLEHIFQENN